MGESISRADLVSAAVQLRTVLATVPADPDHAAYLRGATDTLVMLGRLADGSGECSETKVSGSADAGRVSVLGGLVGVADVRAVWKGLDLDRRRAVLDALMTITLYSPGRGARVFDPGTVNIAWRTS